MARPVSYDNLNVGTKATSAEIAAWENNIYTAFFMVFDNSGNRIIYRDLSPSSGHLTSIPSQTLQADKRYTNAKVCYLVNVSSEYASSLTTYTLLTSTPISIEYAPISSTGCIGVPLLKKTSTDAGIPAIPMFGYKEDCNLSAVTSGYQTNPISLERLFAKVDVKLNVQNGITFSLTNYTVNNIPTKVKLLPPAQGSPTAYASSGDFLTSENTMTSYNLIDPNTSSVTTGFYFYVPEHMQGGTISKDEVDNTVESNKPLLVSGTSRKPTYVEINGVLTKETAEYTGKYLIYLGKNETNDFDLERNTYYKNTVTIKGFTAENRVELLGGDQYTNLVDGEAANCYIITSPGKYILPAYEGATKSLDGATMCYGKPYKVWSDLDDDAITFTYPDKKDSKIVFEISGAEGKFKAGNAVIAIRDDNNNILWSWHLWFCPDGVPSDQDYGNNNYLMDRFLGAKTKATDGVSFISQYLTLYWNDGLFYQSGRKDPFKVTVVTSDTGETYVYEHSVETGASGSNAIKNPTYFYTDWTSSAGWSTSKGQQDPCPPGYRVPDSEVWAKTKDDFNRLIDMNSFLFVYNLATSNTIVYPYGGYIDANNGEYADGIAGLGDEIRTYRNRTDFLGVANPTQILVPTVQPTTYITATIIDSDNYPNPKKFNNIRYEIIDKSVEGRVWGSSGSQLSYGYSDRGVRILGYSVTTGTWKSTFAKTKYADYGNKQPTEVNGDQLTDRERSEILNYINTLDVAVDNLVNNWQGILDDLFSGYESEVIYEKNTISTAEANMIRCLKETP